MKAVDRVSSGRRFQGSAGLRPGFLLTPGLKVGLFGGSFDPAHEGHAHVARTALRRLSLDKVIWLVSPRNPLKRSGPAGALGERIARSRTLANGPSMIVTDIESRLGIRYTVDLIRLLKARFPRVHFVWVMGADSLSGFHTWRDWREIMRLVAVVVVARPGDVLRSQFSPAAGVFSACRLPQSAARRLPLQQPPAWVFLSGPMSIASSTALRDLH